jgi:hypothetical protein
LKVKANERAEERLGELWIGQCHLPALSTADIKGKRLKLAPVDPNDMRALIDMGYVEIPKRRSGGDKRWTSGDRSWRLTRPAPPRGAAPPVRVQALQPAGKHPQVGTHPRMARQSGWKTRFDRSRQRTLDDLLVPSRG